MLAVGSISFGVLVSIFVIDMGGYIEPKPISGARGQEVTNLRSLERSSSFISFSTNFQNHFTYFVELDHPFL